MHSLTNTNTLGGRPNGAPSAAGARGGGDRVPPADSGNCCSVRGVTLVRAHERTAHPSGAQKASRYGELGQQGPPTRRKEANAQKWKRIPKGTEGNYDTQIENDTDMLYDKLF